VTKAFGTTRVLRGVDLDVPPETITSVLGPSGCGKTTLLRIICGLSAADSGVVAFGDRVVVGDGRWVSPQERRVGYVPQEGALFPHMNVAANVRFGLPRKARRSAIDPLLDLVGLPASVADRYPHELSGGQQQRVALARALAPRPTVVLLDEPFSSLDAGLREATGRAVVHALKAAKATAVLVTHDQSEALSLADQVAVMRDGRLVQIGRPVELYREPVDLGVASFVGQAVVLPATVAGDTARCALGEIPVEAGETVGSAQILVRPEQLVIRANGNGTGVPARVCEVSFYGHDAAVRLELLPGGPHVIARIIGTDVPEPESVVQVTTRGRVTVYHTHDRKLS
jgi:iron(III) transport system ATP-binding protein